MSTTFYKKVKGPPPPAIYFHRFFFSRFFTVSLHMELKNTTQNFQKSQKTDAGSCGAGYGGDVETTGRFPSKSGLESSYYTLV
jgi:hypothetical protein